MQNIHTVDEVLKAVKNDVFDTLKYSKVVDVFNMMKTGINEYMVLVIENHEEILYNYGFDKAIEICKENGFNNLMYANQILEIVCIHELKNSNLLPMLV